MGRVLHSVTCGAFGDRLFVVYRVKWEQTDRLTDSQKRCHQISPMTEVRTCPTPWDTTRGGGFETSVKCMSPYKSGGSGRESEREWEREREIDRGMVETALTFVYPCSLFHCSCGLELCISRILNSATTNSVSTRYLRVAELLQAYALGRATLPPDELK